MKTDWEAIYSGQRATDARMEVSRLTCNVCGGLQEECTCEVSELDNANGPPCKHCAHPILSHDEEFGDCGHLGLTDTGWDVMSETGRILACPFCSTGVKMDNQFIEEIGWPQVHGEVSSVKFTVQSGPVKEFGVNGCQIDDVIQWAKEKIEGFNAQYPCRENALIVTKLDEALLWSLKRKLDREKRNVEGTNQK